MSISRLLGLIVLFIFIVFVATFFTVFVRLLRVGVSNDRYVKLQTPEYTEDEPVDTYFRLLGQDSESGSLKFNAYAVIDSASAPFDTLDPGDQIIMRIENLIPDYHRETDIDAEFHNPTGDRLVTVDFGEFLLDVPDGRDFYPFDAYVIRFNFAYYIPGDWNNPAGSWHFPTVLTLSSMTNLIFNNPYYGETALGIDGYKTMVARLRIFIILVITLIMLEILLLIYLLTIANLQELLAKGLSYIIAIFLIRTIIVTNAPQTPTLMDYGMLFLTCVVFFVMLFKTLGGAEERSIITVPKAWTDAVFGGQSPRENHVEKNDDQIDE
ncbi:MAG: hypothetical protein NTY09_00745 [bacterium]|nr:hypothetical protein [bacterium]